jgi:hypothetical protein
MTYCTGTTIFVYQVQVPVTPYPVCVGLSCFSAHYEVSDTNNFLFHLVVPLVQYRDWYLQSTGTCYGSSQCCQIAVYTAILVKSSGK